MNPLRRARRPIGALMIVGTLGLTACGSDDSGISDDSGEQLPPSLDAGTAVTAPGGVEPDQGSGTDSTLDVPPTQSDQVLGTGNIGGTVVDPKPHPIDNIAIAESYPEQLMVRFTSGDPNCTAADATATATGSTVIVTLQVGITEDALSRSCQTGDFEQTVSIALDTGLDGREVIAAET